LVPLFVFHSSFLLILPKSWESRWWVDYLVIFTFDVQNWYHMHLKEFRTLHAFVNWWNVSYLTMWLSEYVHWWNLMNVVKMWIVWSCVHIVVFVIFGDACTLGDFIDDGYFGNNNKVLIIWIWLGDLFDNDDSLPILLKWWIVIRLNCTFGPLSFQKLRLWTPN